MLRMIALALALALHGAASAQDIEIPGQQVRILTGTGAILRGLDKTAGTTRDMELSQGESGMIGHLRVRLGACRYPEDNPAGEAFAWVDVYDTRAEEELFGGWMIASSPALSALDHSRYDLWALSCITS